MKWSNAGASALVRVRSNDEYGKDQLTRLAAGRRAAENEFMILGGEKHNATMLVFACSHLLYPCGSLVTVGLWRTGMTH